jgi:hypothetical protein
MSLFERFLLSFEERVIALVVLVVAVRKPINFPDAQRVTKPSRAIPVGEVVCSSSGLNCYRYTWPEVGCGTGRQRWVIPVHPGAVVESRERVLVIELKVGISPFGLSVQDRLSDSEPRDLKRADGGPEIGGCAPFPGFQRSVKADCVSSSISKSMV